MSERVRRNMQPDKPMTLISLRLPEHIIDDLKEVAPALGFGGYQALIRAYISNGLRKHLAEREAARAKDTAVEEFSRRLLAHGVPAQAIQDAAVEMRHEGGYLTTGQESAMAANGKDLVHKTFLEEREMRNAIPWPVWIPWRAEVWGLLRAARHRTQADVAKALRVPTSAISRTERRQDCWISTLQCYVAALGGQLEMQAVFPDATVDLNTLMDSRTPGPQDG